MSIASLELSCTFSESDAFPSSESSEASDAGELT